MIKPSSIIAVALFAMPASCSDNDDPKIPDNAMTVNLVIDNQSSTIGSSDVYIDDALNFTSRDCRIADMGRRNDMTANPDLSQTARVMAVTPGNLYQIFNTRYINNVAGAEAYPLNASYYNAGVDSWIYDGDNDISGARIRYVECKAQTDRLPEWDTETIIELKVEDGKYEESATVSFGKGVAVSDSYQLYEVDNRAFLSSLQVYADEDKVTFFNDKSTVNHAAEVVLYVRYQSMYTRVRFIVISTLG